MGPRPDGRSDARRCGGRQGQCRRCESEPHLGRSPNRPRRSDRGENQGATRLFADCGAVRWRGGPAPGEPRRSGPAPTGTLMTPLFTVQRIDTIRVFCDVPENDVPHLHIGDPAIIKPSGFDGKPFIGKVTRFSLRLDPETRNMRTEIDLPNPEERLYPGTYAEASLEMNRRPDALTLPSAAVGSDGDGSFVYTIIDNRITRLAVMTGLTDNGRTEVTGGLSGETPVVASTRGVPPLTTAVEPQMVRETP